MISAQDQVLRLIVMHVKPITSLLLIQLNVLLVMFPVKNVRVLLMLIVKTVVIVRMMKVVFVSTVGIIMFTRKVVVNVLMDSF